MYLTFIYNIIFIAYIIVTFIIAMFVMVILAKIFDKNNNLVFTIYIIMYAVLTTSGAFYLIYCFLPKYL